MDWFASGLPGEGKSVDVTQSGDLARVDAPLCQPGESVQDAQLRAEAAGWDTCIVVNDEQIVLGVVHAQMWAANSDALVEEVMDLGPTCYRPNTDLDSSLDYMKEYDVSSLPITTSDGVFVGLLRREDAEREASKDET